MRSEQAISNSDGEVVLTSKPEVVVIHSPVLQELLDGMNQQPPAVQQKGPRREPYSFD